MPSIADVVVQIQASKLPVLFADTCILLDVIRAPLRLNELPGCLQAAQELYRLITSSPVRCTLIVASFVPDEWLRHAASEADNLRTHLSWIDDQAVSLLEFSSLVGITSPFPMPEYRRLPLADRLHDLSRELLGSALRLDPDHDCILRAHARSSSYRPPSLKGGEVRDSTIIEECLEVSRRLQSDGFSPKRIFCTSNKNDYCEKGSSRLHPTLAVDFGSVGLAFATSLPWAVNEIKKV